MVQDVHADDEVLILLENIHTVHIVEDTSGILTGVVDKNGLATRVELDELGEVVDTRINDDPKICVSVVLGNFITSECLAHVDLWRMYIEFVK